ncbi:hypothetical protein D3C75_777400 [compost metagenome]
MNLLFEALDHLKLLRDEYMGESAFSDIASLLVKLRGFVDNSPSLDGPKRELKELTGLTLEQSLRLEEARETGCSILKVQMKLSSGCISRRLPAGRKPLPPPPLPKSIRSLPRRSRTKARRPSGSVWNGWSI